MDMCDGMMGGGGGGVQVQETNRVYTEVSPN